MELFIEQRRKQIDILATKLEKHSMAINYFGWVNAYTLCKTVETYGFGVLRSSAWLSMSMDMAFTAEALVTQQASVHKLLTAHTNVLSIKFPVVLHFGKVSHARPRTRYCLKN